MRYAGERTKLRDIGPVRTLNPKDHPIRPVLRVSLVRRDGKICHLIRIFGNGGGGGGAWGGGGGGGGVFGCLRPFVNNAAPRFDAPKPIVVNLPKNALLGRSERFHRKLAVGGADFR